MRSLRYVDICQERYGYVSVYEHALYGRGGGLLWREVECCGGDGEVLWSGVESGGMFF